jgi:hypothetical protein
MSGNVIAIDVDPLWRTIFSFAAGGAIQLPISF